MIYIYSLFPDVQFIDFAMVRCYKLDKTFGPVGSSAGHIIGLAGIIAIFISLYALVLIFLGLFLAFTSTGSQIDFSNSRIRFTDNIFGFIKVGKWVSITPKMKIGLKKSNIIWTSFSGSNRQLDIQDNDFRLILLDANENEIMVISKYPALEPALVDLDIFSNKLNINQL